LHQVEHDQVGEVVPPSLEAFVFRGVLKIEDGQGRLWGGNGQGLGREHSTDAKDYACQDDDAAGGNEQPPMSCRPREISLFGGGFLQRRFLREPSVELVRKSKDAGFGGSIQTMDREFELDFPTLARLYGLRT
jgi:hypothetical protein